MINIGNMPQRSGTWTWFKTISTVKNVRMQHEESSEIYNIFAYDGAEIMICVIWRNAVPQSVIDGGYSQAQNDSDKSDFETNYKTPGLTNRSVTVGSNVVSVVKTTEFTITSRTETTITALNHTVTTGKDFYLSYFGCAAFGPLSVILRLKVNGATKFVALSWNTVNSSLSLPVPAKIAVSGDAVTVTVEAQVPRGTVWGGFTGIEL